jgi:hypothetical protein
MTLLVRAAWVRRSGMSGEQPGPGGERADPSDERQWAELEGGTEGPRGRGRDQEVISQTVRPESVEVAADHGIAARGLFDQVVHALERHSQLVVERVDRGAVRVLTVRSTRSARRSATLQFDLAGGAVSLARSDRPDLTWLEPVAIGMQALPPPVRDAVSWLTGAGPGDAR